jgi:light-regulated signal transduction histidine kinase (bacteriophytochrome)
MIAIQPCSLLLLVGPDWQVETVSANVAMLGDYRPATVIGQPLADLIGSKAIHSLRNRLAWLSNDESEVQDFGVQWGDVTLDIRAFHGEDCYLVEAELAVEPRLPDGIGMVRSMSDRLSGDNPLDLAGQAMRQIAALTGFERVVLTDRNGAPVAFNQNSATGQAMDAVETSRLVADREAEPVPLVGDEDISLLARAAFRAPETDEYNRLGSLGVAATMALPLRIDGELVGAVHAHHSTPRRVGAERRSVAHLFAERLVARMARRGWNA